MKIGLVVPHIFMHRNILPQVIFSPAQLALDLAAGLQRLGADVTLFSPGPVDTPVRNVTADLSLFAQELRGRGYGYVELLRKHPVTFVSLARQVQAEIIADAFAMANRAELDVVHIYTNEEDIALPFAALCAKPVVFTHHDPFNFLVKYKNTFPKYAQRNWLSLSLAQQRGMPANTNWIGNVYHGLRPTRFQANMAPHGNYVAYLGRIIEPKGVHMAIGAVRQYNAAHPHAPLKLKLAGKHYAGHKDTYWQETIRPAIDGRAIEYVGFIDNDDSKQAFLGNARALLVPSTFAEPFGMVLIEALACGTPVIGLDSGAIPEVIRHGVTGFVTAKHASDDATAQAMAAALERISDIKRQDCRADFETRFTTERMCREHLAAYAALIQKPENRRAG